MTLRLSVWIVGGVIALASAASAGSQAERVAPSVQPEISFANGVLSASFREVSLGVVCEQLSAATKVAVVLSPGLETRTISSDIRVLPIEEAFRKVLLDYDAFFFYDASAAPARLRTVWVFPKGSASGIRPVRPEQCASSKDIETALRESDPAARSLAYEALLERPDRNSRTLITEALRGIREPDAGVRERLLSMALSRGFELSPEVLADLARADASENIRLIAVDALAEHPSAKEIAQAALTDPSAAVRARAKEVLSEVSRGNERHQAETERAEQQ
jgi:hypothetical protein